jgi:hypothetical protein
MLNVAMLNVVVLNVAAPRSQLENVSGKRHVITFKKMSNYHFISNSNGPVGII